MNRRELLRGAIVAAVLPLPLMAAAPAVATPAIAKPPPYHDHGPYTYSVIYEGNYVYLQKADASTLKVDRVPMMGAAVTVELRSEGGLVLNRIYLEPNHGFCWGPMYVDASMHVKAVEHRKKFA